MTDAGGLVLSLPDLYLIFWGTHWQGNPTLSMAEVGDAFDRIARGCYLLALAQYRFAGNGARVAGTALVASALANGGLASPADPPDQYQGSSAFKSAEIPVLIANSILAGRVPPPPPNGQVAYCVILPENTVNLDTGGGFWGEHGNNDVAYVDANGHKQSLDLTWLWVTHAGVLSELTDIFGHELAETCSDPGWKGTWAFGVKDWQPRGATSGTGSEIGDICEGYNGTVNGLSVQSYFSNADQTCIVPTFAWQSLPGAATAVGMAVNTNQDGRLELFATCNDGALRHVWQTTPNGGWSGFANLGGTPAGRPVAARNADGRLEVFVRGTDNALWHIWQVAPNGGWSGWASLGGVLAGDPAAANNADGRLEVFYCGSDGAVWHVWQTVPNGGWSGFASLGGGVQGLPAVGRNADGRLEVFVRGNDNALWHIWQAAPNGGWSDWESLGGALTGNPVVASNTDGRVEVFATGTDGGLWHIWQTAPNNGWSAWSSLARPTVGAQLLVPLAIQTNADGRIEVFAIEDSFDQAIRVWHIWQTNVPAAPWGDWRCLSGAMFDSGLVNAAVCVGKNADGRLEVFASRASDQTIGHVWQLSPGGQWAVLNQTSGC